MTLNEDREGVGALEAPQYRHRQEGRTGTSRAEQTDRDHCGAGSSGGHGRWSSGPWSPRPGPYSRNSYYPPPPKISLGKWGGIRSPPGLNRQDKQDSPQEPEALLGWLGGWGFFWAWPGVRGPHRDPQRPPPFQRQGVRRLEWPPWPQQEEPSAPDESPWTRQDLVS